MGASRSIQGRRVHSTPVCEAQAEQQGNEKIIAPVAAPQERHGDARCGGQRECSVEGRSRQRVLREHQHAGRDPQCHDRSERRTRGSRLVGPVATCGEQKADDHCERVAED